MKGNLEELIKSEKTLLIDFSAEWCGPCKALAPTLKSLSTEMGDRVRIIKIDVDKNPSASQKFKIAGVPTLILFKNGEQKWRQSGALPLSQLRQVINQFG